MKGLNLGSNPVFNKGREAAESIRERWETSDSPLVHRIQVGAALPLKLFTPRPKDAHSQPSDPHPPATQCSALAPRHHQQHNPFQPTLHPTHPLLCPGPRHPPQDAVDSFQTESEQARALREIRARDPAFDMVTFLRNLKQDVGVVIKVGG